MGEDVDSFKTHKNLKIKLIVENRFPWKSIVVEPPETVEVWMM